MLTMCIAIVTNIWNCTRLATNLWVVLANFDYLVLQSR